MNIRIHPVEKSEEYTDLLLTLLAQAWMPVLIEEFQPGQDKV